MSSFLLFLVWLSTANAVVQDVTLCFWIETDWLDPGGDWWPDNSADRRARGVHFTTRRIPFAAVDRQADSDGCLTFSLDTMYQYSVTVRSEADVNGIALESYTETAETEDFGDLDLETHTYFLPPYTTSANVTIPWDQTWGNLALGMWAFYRNDMNLGTFSSRRCCHSTGHACYNTDGTCDSGPACAAVELYPGSAFSYDYETVIFVNQTWEDAGCCGSWWPMGTEEVDEQFPAVRVNYPSKYLTAHELGHVVVEMRVGGRTYVDQSADLDKCMGSYTGWDFDPSIPGASVSDSYSIGGKAELTREYHSTAAREGWASFYASWLFNAREDDCMYNSQIIHDFDLDRDIDNNYGDSGIDYVEAYTFDGAFDCEGVGVGDLGEPFSSDPLETYVDAKDWLEDVVTEHVCGYPSYDLAGVSTQYDWHRYFWDMYDDSDVDVNELADIYVDACPAHWDPDSTNISLDNSPAKRFYISADYHGKLTEHLTEDNNGQDH